MYSFAQRSDTRVVDEPLYAHYLARSPARAYHPGAEAVLASQQRDGAAVVRDVILGPCDRPVLFLKQMTHHLVDLDLDFLHHTTNVLLTRDPREMLPSYAQQVETPTLSDTGYPQSVALLDHLESIGHRPAVLDARALLLDPESVLEQLCRRLGLAFDAAMLRWPAGPRPEDGVWAEYWYDNVHRSTGFAPYRPRGQPLPAPLEPLLAACAPLYERLVGKALRGRRSAAEGGSRGQVVE
jgi:hypothetical protein